MTCPLCDLHPLTRLYYMDAEFTVLECRTCHIPMIVYNTHTMKIPLEEFSHIYIIVDSLFGSDMTLRLNQRSIHDHWHAHILRSPE